MLRGLRPSMPVPPLAEILRAAIGAALGLFLTDLVLWFLGGGGERPLSHITLIAPLGATAYLIFSVPNSPLAQPWSVVAGNSLSALCALAVLHLGLPLVPAFALAVPLAMGCMALARAMHPPGGAMAIATIMLTQGAGAPQPGFSFLFGTILAGSATLVALGMVWNPLTGRSYPLRQPSAAPAQRQTPGPLALAQALDRLRMGANLGVEDLSRLIAAAESITAAEDLGPMTAGRLMSQNLATLDPATPLPEAARLFRRTGYRHLPLVGDGEFMGLVPQTALLGPLPELALFDLSEKVQSVSSDTSLADLLALMATGRQICIPVVDQGHLQGLITRTDLLAAMTHGPLSR